MQAGSNVSVISCFFPWNLQVVLELDHNPDGISAAETTSIAFLVASATVLLSSPLLVNLPGVSWRERILYGAVGVFTVDVDR
jgi:hypothetical protein